VQPVLPHDVRQALDLLEADPGRDHGVKALAASCGVAPRTLQKHFRRFIGRTPREVQWALRMERARRDLLAPPEASMTDIALRWGFKHLGRFAMLYRRRYNESPSSTLRYRRSALARGRISAPSLRFAGERPLVGVLPFTVIGTDSRWAAAIADGNHRCALPQTLDRRWAIRQCGGHHFTARPVVEKQAARELAAPPR